MPNSRVVDPLRKPNFRRLATSYAVNELGDWMGIVALSVLVYDQTGSPLDIAVLFLGTRFLPAILAPLLVVRVERPSPRLVLPLIYVGEAVAFAALALLAAHFSMAVVLVLAVVDGSLALTGRTLTRAVTAAMLKPAGELRAGNAILNMAFTGGAALGPALAGAAVAGLGIQWALLLDAASFCAIAAILLTARALPHAEPEPGRLVERLRAGFVYIRGNPILRRLLIAEGVAFVFFAVVIPIEVVYAKETLGSGDAGYGLLLASWGVGMMLGSVLFAGLRRASLSRLLFFSTISVGAGYLGLAAAPTLVLACAASTLGGAGNGVQWVAVVSAVQEFTSPRMQTRVMSVLESLGAAVPGVAYLLGGLIAAAGSPRTTFLVAGVGIFAVVVVATVVLGPGWSRETGEAGDHLLDANNAVVLELLPGSSPSNATRR